ncbi:hypothetical protein [Chishuiella changwenlii]|uniref:hypothetical protein n=1 Tax=Chishuiella changwenlii TaxID=1434701 RepID=UPI002FD987AC
MKKNLSLITILLSIIGFSQESQSKIKVSLFEGTVVAGYVDNGGFINFTGPSVSYKHNDFKMSVGMLPSLRIKEDKSPGTKNSVVTPNLGGGLTFVYKKIALQMPFYYNTKTSTQDGTWKMGIGVGYSFK